MKWLFFLLCFTFILVPPIQAADDDLPERLIVTFKENTPIEEQERVLASIDGLDRRRLRLPRKASIKLKTPKIPKTTLDAIASEPSVAFVEPDYQATAFTLPNDPKIGDQWGLVKIQAHSAWSNISGNTHVAVAILDSGINQAHPDLAEKVIKRVNFTNDPDTDAYGHGTHVAGIISAQHNNAIGIAGLAPNTHVYAVKVLDNRGQGYYSWIADGIMWATDQGAKVINISLGGTSPSQTLEQAIDYAWDHGVVVVAAAGNSGSTRPAYPAYYTQVIAVGATDTKDARVSFSTYGDWVDVAAPGVSIISTYKNDYAFLSGTSMATPHVSGVAALLFSLHPDWTNTMVRTKLEQTSDVISGQSQYWHNGRINACRALDCIALPMPMATPTPTPTPRSERSILPRCPKRYTGTLRCKI